MRPRQNRRSLSIATHFFCASLAVGLPAALLSAHAQKGRSADVYDDSRLDLYAGYGYLHPFNSDINGYQYQPVSTPNVTASVTGWLTHNFGVQVEGGYFSGSGEHQVYKIPCRSTSCDQLAYSAEGGPVFRLPFGRFVPFAHALGGGERTNGPAQQNLQWGWGITGGLGVDYVLPFFHDHLAVRPVQADYQFAHVDHGPLVPPAGILGGLGEMDAFKISGGLVLRTGEKSDVQPVMLGCTAEPVAVHPGETVTVNGSTLYLNPKRRAQFTWLSNGGKITPAGAMATVDTTGLAPGEYTVEGHVSEGSKPRENASCTAPFTVRAIQPPTVACSASPTSAQSGTPILILATASSPQNRPLTYSYATSAGQISGTGNTAKLITDGLGDTTVKVTCNVVDDQGLSATSNVSVSISRPAPPVVPESQALCSISFNRDRRRPVRVDNESKACLDDIAVTLSQQNSSKLVIIGDASPDEKPVAAAQRALNERQYLTDEKGIDTSRIEVRVGDTSGRIVKNILVPNGAIFNDTDTKTFDIPSIARSGQAYGSAHPAGVSHAPAHRRSRRSRKRAAAAGITSAMTPNPGL